VSRIEEPPGTGAAPAGRLSRALSARPLLLIAFAFAVMADPVSSVAYAPPEDLITR